MTVEQYPRIPSGADYPWDESCIQKDQPHTIEEALTRAAAGDTWQEGIDVYVGWWVSDITEASCWFPPEQQDRIPAGATVQMVEVCQCCGDWVILIAEGDAEEFV